jgi:hypothetical protein
MEIVNQQRRLTAEPSVDRAQRHAVGFALRELFPLGADHPLTPFDEMPDQLENRTAAESLPVS